MKKLEKAWNRDKIQCKRSSFKNIVDNAWRSYNKKEQLSMIKKLENFMVNLNEQEIDEFDPSSLKKDPNFSMYVRESIKNAWNRLKKVKFKK